MARARSGIAKSIVDFMPQFNDKINSLFPLPRPSAVDSLTKSQVRVLMLVSERPGQTATELGDGLGMTKANLTGILDELESKGLAERAADPKDRRKFRVGLTAPGRKKAEAIAREFDKVLESRIAPLSEKERLAFASHMSALTELLTKL